MDALEKDSILLWLHEHAERNCLISIPSDAIISAGWSYSYFTSFVEQLERMGLVSDVSMNATVIYLVILPEMIDFLMTGGFSAQQRALALQQENLELSNLYLKSKLDMLQQEAERIKVTDPALAERLIHIAASIATVFSVSLGK